MRLWTIQSKEVIETIERENIWVPDFSKSTYPEKVPGFRELYDLILQASNKNNGRGDEGLVFCFMKIVNDEVFPINGGLNEFLGFLYDNYDDVSNICSTLLTDDSYILEIEINLGSFFPTLIELNDWNLLAYGVDLPPYPQGYCQYLREQILDKKITITNGVHSNIMQAHIPYLKKEDIVHIYPVDRNNN